uniref:Uncharacterized protein MANES_13G136300 n=1 Tax=Rhizophora mucronata TaxID=61149 RepID=A0A2P2J4L1_RHIMU
MDCIILLVFWVERNGVIEISCVLLGESFLYSFYGLFNMKLVNSVPSFSYIKLFFFCTLQIYLSLTYLNHAPYHSPMARTTS